LEEEGGTPLGFPEKILRKSFALHFFILSLRRIWRKKGGTLIPLNFALGGSAN